MDEREIHQRAAEIHRQNTEKVIELLERDNDLHTLATVLDEVTAQVYQRVLPRYAQLCEDDQRRGLTDAERGELAVGYASLYPTFGHEGTVLVAAMWLATRPARQAKGN